MTRAPVEMTERFQCAERVHARRFERDAVVLDLKGGAYFGLDEVGAEIWEDLVEGRSLGEIAARLQGLYDVAPERLATDIRALVEELVAKGLVVPQAQP